MRKVNSMFPCFHVFMVLLMYSHVFIVFLLTEVEVVDKEEVGGRQNGGRRAADKYLAVQVVEVGNPP